MMRRLTRVPLGPPGLAVLVAVTAATVGLFHVVRESQDQSRQRSFERRARGAAAIISTLGRQAESLLQQGAVVGEATGGDSGAFRRALEGRLRGSVLANVALLDVGGRPAYVHAWAGRERPRLLRPLSAPARRALLEIARTGKMNIANLRTVNGVRVVGIAAAAEPGSRYVAYGEILLPIASHGTIDGVPRVDGVGYILSRIDDHGTRQVLTSTVSRTKGRTYVETMRLGSERLVFTFSDAAGGGTWLAAVAPWAVLGLGLLLGTAAAALVEARRHARREAVRLEALAREHAELDRSEERLRAIVRNASDLIALVDCGGAVTSLTGAAAGLLGAGWETCVGRPLADLVHPDDRPLVPRALAEAVSGDGGSLTVEWRLGDGAAEWRHAEIVITSLLDAAAVGGIVVTARDVSERKAFVDQLRHRAFHDGLTHLANRALFYDRVEHALARGGLERGAVAVLFVDLDGFKDVNDGYGHAVGDAVLVEAARRLRGCVRQEDTAARLGGDEFGILVEDVTGPAEAIVLAERVLQALGDPFCVGDEPFAVGACAGIALSTSVAGGSDDLLRAADLSMYAAKAAGRGRYEVYEPELEEGIDELGTPSESGWLRRRDDRRSEILSVLARPQTMRIVCQPILDLRTGLVTGFEALARFADEERPPNVWFQQAHQVGLGPQLEAAAIRMALELPGLPPGTHIALNCSPGGLLSREVQAVLPESLEGIVIEVTENELIGERSRVAEALEAVRGRGALIAVDDTGSGYAGLTRLMRVRPDVIKLDRALIDGVRHDPGKAALIEALVDYADRIDALVLAEGVEDLDDLAVVAQLDVAFAQGFAIARPGPGWPTASPESLETCRRAAIDALGRDATLHGLSDGHEQRLERVISRIARTESVADLEKAFAHVARELRADLVTASIVDAGGDYVETLASHGSCIPERRFSLSDYPATASVIATGRPLQVIARDAGADPTEVALMRADGVSSLLMLPVVAGTRTIGLLEVERRADQAWTRHELHRARIVAFQLAEILGRVTSTGLRAVA